MLRVYHSGFLQKNTIIELSPEASHHVLNVMRLKVDSNLRVFNVSGEYMAILSSNTKKIASLTLGEKLNITTESDCEITLLQAVTRRERMDYSIQKATEMGVSCIQPVLTQHCVVKLNEKKAQQRIEHWNGIALHATEQSGRLKVPEIKSILSWDAALAEYTSSKYLKLIFALAASKALSEIEVSSKNILLALGPVGGFSTQELEKALAKDYRAIKLGPRILRAETATTAALTAIQMRWGDLDI